MHPQHILRFAAVILCATSLQSQAQQILMAHKNATAGINITNDFSGVQNWTIDGVHQLAYQAFLYRVGPAGGESFVSTIDSTPTVSFTQVPNILSLLDVTYANNNYSVRTVFQLSGGNNGSGTANLSETLTIQNLSANPLDFHFFQYSDFDLGGSIENQTATFQFDGLGQPYKVIQTDGVRTLTETVNANASPVGHYEASGFPALINSLTDANPTTLGDVPSYGPGDATFAYQWDMILDPGQSFVISKLMTIVPEPASASLVLVGLSAALLGRRRK